MDVTALATEIINGRRLSENDDLGILKEAAFRSGASATITGDMLTTSGSTIKSDREMLIKLGREVIQPDS